MGVRECDRILAFLNASIGFGARLRFVEPLIVQIEKTGECAPKTLHVIYELSYL
jgi:hypothetical protein